MRTAPLQPPATDILYDQLDMLLAELGKRNLTTALSPCRRSWMPKRRRLSMALTCESRTGT